MEGAWSYYNAGDYEKSIEYGKRALRGAKETGNKERKAEACTVLAWSYHEAGDYGKSIEQGKEALSGAKETGNKEWEAAAYDVLARSYHKAGDYEKSIKQGKKFLSGAKETGNKKKEAEAYNVLAWSYYEVGDYEKSIEQGKQLLSAAKESGNKERETEAYDVLAASYNMARDYKRGIKYGKYLLSGAKKTGNKEREAEAYNVLAWSYCEVGDYEKSIEQGKQLLSAAKEKGKKESETDAYSVLALSYYNAGDYEKSIEYGKQALSVAKETGNKEKEAAAHEVLTKSYHGLGDRIQDEQLLHDDGDDNDDGNGDDGNHGNMGDAVNDEVSKEQDLNQQFHELQLIGQKRDLFKQDPDKTKIHEGIVTSEGAHWDLKQGAVQLAFSPGAVSEPISIMVLTWICSACSPQLQEQEAIVSNVIEISTKNGQPLEFNAQVMLMLYHSAPDLQGYELVIKMQTDKKISEWVDVDGTEDLRRLRGIDTYASSQDMPDLNSFIARASITKCSTYTVVSRLKSSPSYTITSNGGLFDLSYYPGVTVNIPENAVAPKTTFPLVFKAQEIPFEEYEDQGVFVGPFLRIICSQDVKFLKPVTIQLPVHVRGGPKGIPDPLSYHVRVLFQKSDGKYKEWIDITSDLEHPASFDGTFVKFQVKHFCSFSCTVSRDRESVSHPAVHDRLSSLASNQPTRALFFAFFSLPREPYFHSILHLICCTVHLRQVVLDELEKKEITPHEDHCAKYLIPKQDLVFVFASRENIDVGISKEVCFRFESDSPVRKELIVRLCKAQVPIDVEFYSTSSKQKRLSTLSVLPPSVHPTAPKKPTPSQRPGFKRMAFAKKWGRKGLRRTKVVKGNSEVESEIETKAKKRTHKGTKTVRADADVKGKIKTSEGRTELKVKDGIPSNDDLEWISRQITHWKHLGRRLAFDEAALDHFHEDNDTSSERAYAMLIAWKKRKGSAATYQVLYDALCHGLVDRLDLAERFCCH